MILHFSRSDFCGTVLHNLESHIISDRLLISCLDNLVSSDGRLTSVKYSTQPYPFAQFSPNRYTSLDATATTEYIANTTFVY